ncbi:hypothetical protein BH09PSE6_BH09PSE6_07040 [soil metagenome]
MVCSHSAYSIGALQVEPFPVPHDAREPTQFVFVSGSTRLGVLTDVGAGTPRIVQALAACDALILEFNHDEAMLQNSSYPPSVRKRIAGQHGHLSNSAAAAILSSLDRHKLKRLHAAHLSQQNNRPELVLEALATVGTDGIAVELATQADGFGWMAA